MSKSVTPEYNRLKVLLAEKKKTSRELADYLKVRPGTVSRWCTNDSQPTIATLFEIAKYLDVKASALLVDQ
ncbi:MAG TPA: helix-turn-helix transcriptional regulator [Cyclobacteriaceae bacterium]|jgi:transcriptional regulator with XRE-family HTH domain|nr:helix-turn-helix transcriptional regulator [Cyclobacteriaceae bacterium]